MTAHPPGVSAALAAARLSLSNPTQTGGSSVSAVSESPAIPEPTSQPPDRPFEMQPLAPLSPQPEQSEVDELRADLEAEWARAAELERVIAAQPTLGAFRRLRAQIAALGAEPVA